MAAAGPPHVAMDFEASESGGSDVDAADVEVITVTPTVAVREAPATPIELYEVSGTRSDPRDARVLVSASSNGSERIENRKGGPRSLRGISTS